MTPSLSASVPEGLREGAIPVSPPSAEELQNLHPGALLYRAAGAPPNLPTMADALAHGADVNWVNVAQESRTPLLQAVAAVSLRSGSRNWGDGLSFGMWGGVSNSTHKPPFLCSTQNSLLACEFLLQNGASVNQPDSRGRGPIHHATILGFTGYGQWLSLRDAWNNFIRNTFKNKIK